ncbi:MAG: DUF2892 domain-containing protein [Bacteroidetes bacterium]|nr:DUF2892 domain-containing protein [Bacteroidota bacterium]
MVKNLGTPDRIVRSLLAVGAAIAIISGAVTGTAAIVLGVIAAVLLLTSLVSFCPLYAPFRISTAPKGAKK